MSNLLVTEQRGYQELYLSLQSMQKHWQRLAKDVRDKDALDALRFGAQRTATLLRDLQPVTENLDVFGGPLTFGAGRINAAVQNLVRDPFLEANQAIRLAILDAEHIANLLEYLAAAASQRGDEITEAFLVKWQRRFHDLTRKARKAAVGLLADPDQCVQPVHHSLRGKVCNGLARWVGNRAEATDQRLGKKQAR